MKITREEIKKMDAATLINAVHWLYDTTRRLELSGNIGPQSKAQSERLRNEIRIRKRCISDLLALAGIVTGRSGMAPEISIITCPVCDSCGWPVIENHGDDFSTLCKICAKSFTIA